MFPVEAADRVLLLSIPAAAEMDRLLDALPEGVCVAIDADDAVREARRHHQARVNVLFIPAAPHELPWQDAYFTKVLPPAAATIEDPAKLAYQIIRVTAPGGVCVLADENAKLAGYLTPYFVPAGDADGFACWRKVR